VICRPVDVLEGPDGRLFVSDDYAGLSTQSPKRLELPPNAAGMCKFMALQHQK
jgi:hypothetical protein